jgi:hypothetical protein
VNLLNPASAGFFLGKIRKSFAAKDAKDAEEQVQLYRGGRETAKEQKSFNAKELTIKSETNPKGAKDCVKGGIWTRPQNTKPQEELLISASA